MIEAIAEAIKKYNAATRDLKFVLQREQQKCKHEKVIHSKWRSSDFGSAFKARRLCLDCGLEEEAGHSGWGDGDSDFKALKTKGLHKVVDADVLYSSRFPEAEVSQ